MGPVRNPVCVECLIGKQKKPILFKVTEPSSVPHRAPPACAKMAAYPDPTRNPHGTLTQGAPVSLPYQNRDRKLDAGFWVSDYRGAVRVGRTFGQRRFSPVRGWARRHSTHTVTRDSSYKASAQEACLIKRYCKARQVCMQLVYYCS